MSRKKILIIAIVLIAVIAVVGVLLWQLLGPSFAEAENAMNSFITALNNYDAGASWALMSPDLQDYYGSKDDFNSSVLDGFRQASWHAQIAGISSRSLQTTNGVTTARFVVTLQISEAGMDAYSQTYTFKLIKIGDQWKIDDMLVGTWD